MGHHEALVPIVLGHNAFFGVNHLSASRGAEVAASFADPNRIVAMISAAKEHGAQGMMMSTHERASPLCAVIRQNPDLASDMVFYPLLPYIQKYVTRSNEVGMANVVIESLKGSSLSERLSFIWKGTKGVIAKDVDSVLSALMQLELAPFKGLRLGAVFLHDALTDLALALGLREIFEFYIEEIGRRYDTTGAFATKNLPTLVERFAEWGLPTPVVLTHFNKLGFNMNPSQEACEAVAMKNDVHIMAMSTLASGYIRPAEAYGYLERFGCIESVVVGVSSAGHATETFAELKQRKWGVDTSKAMHQARQAKVGMRT